MPSEHSRLTFSTNRTERRHPDAKLLPEPMHAGEREMSRITLPCVLVDGCAANSASAESYHTPPNSYMNHSLRSCTSTPGNATFIRTGRMSWRCPTLMCQCKKYVGVSESTQGDLHRRHLAPCSQTGAYLSIGQRVDCTF